MAWLLAVLLVSCLSGVGSAPDLPSLQDDTTCTTPENQWFDCAQHEAELTSWFQSARAAAEHNVHCLDWFGASQSVSRTWIARGYRAFAFDIKLCTSQDMVNRDGCYLLLKMAAQLHAQAALICAPPCSLFSPACASVHKRNWFRPEGDTTVFLVRLSQQILSNFAVLLRILLTTVPTLNLVVEQPSGSWSYKQWFMEILIEDLHLILISTWLAYWSHDMLKGTHLLSNRMSAQSFSRRLSAKDRRRFNERFAKRQAQRGPNKKIYHQKIRKPSGALGWQGGKDLASSARFTRSFCLALLQWWQRQSGL